MLKWKQDSLKRYHEERAESEKLGNRIAELETRDSEKDIAITELELRDIESSIAGAGACSAWTEAGAGADGGAGRHTDRRQ